MEQVKNIKKSFKESKIYKIYQNLLNRKWFPYVFFLYVIAFIMFFATLVNNEFTIPVSGDFTLQEIPFYYNGYDEKRLHPHRRCNPFGNTYEYDVLLRSA